MTRYTIAHIVAVIARLDRMGWPAWKMEEAYQLMRRARTMPRR